MENNRDIDEINKTLIWRSDGGQTEVKCRPVYSSLSPPPLGGGKQLTPGKEIRAYKPKKRGKRKKKGGKGEKRERKGEKEKKGDEKGRKKGKK